MISRRPSARIERLVRTHAGDYPSLVVLFDRFLAQRAYDRAFASSAVSVARDGAQQWPVRRVATLILEHTLLRAEDEELDRWRRELGIDGYDAISLRARLQRHARIHDAIDGYATTDSAIGDFFHIARRECRLTLARWLFGANEVIARIEKNVRRSRGIRCRPDFGHRFVGLEARRATESLPPLERAIVDHLGADAAIRWVANHTSDEINSLIEFPVGTVAMVIKPPGSDREIEIKRSGVKGDFPLDVAYRRGDWIVPPTHHLHGGSMEHMLAFEASHSSIFSKIYRIVHGVDAPMSRTIHLATIYGVPSPAGEADILDYFTDPRVYGAGYRDMRKRLDQTLDHLARADNRARPAAINALSVTGEFLGLMKPAQAIQTGTTSFRLERLRSYLRPNGDERYFKRGRGIEYTRDDARRFADEILDEILCIYEPPRVPFRSYRSYLDAAFAVRANRDRAHRNYLDVMGQIGHFWGTLLGARGHSAGESFVGRNAGLRAVFEEGRWRIRIIFMDHDSMFFASRNTNAYRPVYNIGMAAKDAKFILGGYFGKVSVLGEVEYLRDIYRATPALERNGLAAMRAAMKRAYDRTHEVMREHPEMREIFRPRFLATLKDWDDVVQGYLSARRTPAQRRAWKGQTLDMLKARGYGEKIAAEYVGTVTRQWAFLRKIAFVFGTP